MSRELPDTVLVAEILRPHGLRGEVVAEDHSDNKKRFKAGRELSMTLGGATRPITIESSRRHKGRLLLKLEGVDSRDDADGLRGAELEVPLEDVPPAPDGLYYFYELVGCRCVDRREGDIGEVIDVVEDGGGLLLEVERCQPDSPEGALERFLIPFVKSFVLEVKTAEGILETELPEGLLELCVSTS